MRKVLWCARVTQLINFRSHTPIFIVLRWDNELHVHYHMEITWSGHEYILYDGETKEELCFQYELMENNT